MSVARLRENMERPGCQWIVTIILLGMAGGFLFGGSQCRGLLGNGQENLNGNQDQGEEIATIGDFKVYLGPIQKQVNGSPSQGGGGVNPLTSTASDYATAYARALDTQVTQCLLLEVAKQNGFPLDDDAILEAMGSQIDQQFDQQKMMAPFQDKSLPQNMTDQQFSDYFKKKNGKTPAEQKAAELDQYKQLLSDPQMRDNMLHGLANDIVMNGFSKSIPVSDDDLKHSRDEYVTKRILFLPDKHKGQDLEKLADQVDADLKSKKIKFEDAMDKYSDESVAKGKKAHDNTNEVDTMTWKTNPDYEKVRDLKQGEISDVIPNKPSGYAIYQLENVISPPIPNFDKTKNDIKKQYLQTLAAEKLQDGLKQLRASGAIKWDDPDWGLLEDWYQATTGQDSGFSAKPKAEQLKIDQGFVDKAMSAKQDPPAFLTAAGAFDPIWTAASEVEKKSLSDEYEKILTGFAAQFPCFTARMEIVKLAAEKGTKEKDVVFQNLMAAVQINQQGVSDPSGQVNFSDIARATDQYHEKGLLTSEQVSQVQDKLDAFRDEKLRFDAQNLQEQKQEAAERAKEEAARAKAEASKPKPAAPAPPPSPFGKGVRALPPGPSGPGAPPKFSVTPAAPPANHPATTPPVKTRPAGAKPTVKIIPTPVGGK